MPRIQRGLIPPPRSRHPQLVAELAEELRHSHDVGQPWIEEQVFPRTNAIRVLVVWDRWAALADEERSTAILQAYEQVEGKDFSDRIALPIGLTVPEAHESGLLPYRILPALRKQDAVTAEQCTRAILEQGASTLADPANPELRFATEAEAEACRKRLIEALPGSDPVWVITRETGRVEM